jgi:ring-1,2-phenylacetyl-CoA epoxidase subunit PaaC
MGFDTAYEAISEETGDLRWAFGTGFVDPLEGVDTSVPPGIDGSDLGTYCLMLADDALIMSHRLQQWLSRAPELEEETALANVALDLLGQSRLLLTRAGRADGSGRDEDALAFFRSEHEFLNVRMLEPLDDDFARLLVRLFAFSTWRLATLVQLRRSRDPVLAAIAAAAVNEVSYHREYAAQWVVTLGDGTDYSRSLVKSGLAAVAPYVPELFWATGIEHRVAASGFGPHPADLRDEFDRVMGQVLASAGLEWPEVPDLAGVAGRAGREGVHTEAMGFLLAELQSVARAHPGATW